MTNCRFLNEPEKAGTRQSVSTHCCYAMDGRVIRDGAVFSRYCAGNPEFCAVHRLVEDGVVHVTASEHIGSNYTYQVYGI
jgi:hypothetical protein